jgi:hypothetical protein
MPGHVGIVSADRVQGQKNSWPEPEPPCNHAGCQQSHKSKQAEPAVSLEGGSGISPPLAYRRVSLHGGVLGSWLALRKDH